MGHHHFGFAILAALAVLIDSVQESLVKKFEDSLLAGFVEEVICCIWDKRSGTHV